jgi:hypothetical protein
VAAVPLPWFAASPFEVTMSTADMTGTLSKQVTPELREKLHRQLERIHRTSDDCTDDLTTNDGDLQIRPTASSTSHVDLTANDGDCGDDALESESEVPADDAQSSEAEVEPLEYIMLTAASRLPKDEAAELLDKVKRWQDRHEKTLRQRRVSRQSSKPGRAASDSFSTPRSRKGSNPQDSATEHIEGRNTANFDAHTCLEEFGTFQSDGPNTADKGSQGGSATILEKASSCEPPVRAQRMPAASRHWRPAFHSFAVLVVFLLCVCAQLRIPIRSTSSADVWKVFEDGVHSVAQSAIPSALSRLEHHFWNAITDMFVDVGSTQQTRDAFAQNETAEQHTDSEGLGAVERARDRAIELAMAHAVQQQTQRGVDKAAERLTGVHPQSAIPSCPARSGIDANADDAQARRSDDKRSLRDRVQDLEEEGFVVLLRPPPLAIADGSASPETVPSLVQKRLHADKPALETAALELRSFLQEIGIPDARAASAALNLVWQGIDAATLRASPPEDLAAVFSAPELGLPAGERLRALAALRRTPLDPGSETEASLALSRARHWQERSGHPGSGMPSA